MLPTSRYEPALADRAVAFINSLKHTKGVWAGQPFQLLPWQEEIIRNIFGVVKPNGFRQFNTAYVEMGKKGGKRNRGYVSSLTSRISCIKRIASKNSPDRAPAKIAEIDRRGRLLTLTNGDQCAVSVRNMKAVMAALSAVGSRR